eukprot:gnl/MRDRNA2_/MRDRNA2_112395_c0_seq1.p1 gnl/MRDRNA2_/MRDRNA2_112395_c0~~gnl/MRDRNA2_/MRDRNA2_112395_c0_seq1.p1  ORF type:complete len:132 (+),score=21.96 gnl/MRDRNA2_/MRDRNA2_112395_c0_seq1:89-484(+)
MKNVLAFAIGMWLVCINEAAVWRGLKEAAKPQCTDFSCKAGFDGAIDTKAKCKDACQKCLGGEWSCPSFKTSDHTVGETKDHVFHQCTCSKDNCKNKWDSICEDSGFERGSTQFVKPSLAIIACFFVAFQH